MSIRVDLFHIHGMMDGEQCLLQNMTCLAFAPAAARCRVKALCLNMLDAIYAKTAHGLHFTKPNLMHNSSAVGDSYVHAKLSEVDSKKCINLEYLVEGVLISDARSGPSPDHVTCLIAAKTGACELRDRSHLLYESANGAHTWLLLRSVLHLLLLLQMLTSFQVENIQLLRRLRGQAHRRRGEFKSFRC